MQSNVNFGDSLTEILLNRNISVQKLAEDIGVSLATVYDWKKNDQDIKLSHLNAIANYFHCTIEYLIGRSDDETFVDKKRLPLFGARLRKVMTEKKITTYKLRQKGYGSKHFENWDKGADPFLSTLIDLSNIFECSIDYLVGRE